MKQVWGLGAAVLTVLLVVAFWTVFVTGRLATTERLAPSEMVEGIEVPVIGTVGDFPEPEHRVVVNVTAEGRIVVDGAAYAPAAFVVELDRRAERVRGDRILGIEPPRHLSDLAIVLRVDGRLPWGCAQQLVPICAESSAWRISFAVRHESDGDEGALGVPLPKHSPDCGHEPDEIAWREIDVSAADDGATPAALRSAFTAAATSGKTVGVHLHVDPDLPTTVALQTIDAAVRAGVTRFDVLLERVEGSRIKSGAIYDAALRRPPVPFTGCAIRMDGAAVVGAGASLPASPRVRGAAVVPALSYGEVRPPAPPPIVAPAPTRESDVIPK